MVKKKPRKLNFITTYKLPEDEEKFLKDAKIEPKVQPAKKSAPKPRKIQFKVKPKKEQEKPKPKPKPRKIQFKVKPKKEEEKPKPVTKKKPIKFTEIKERKDLEIAILTIDPRSKILQATISSLAQMGYGKENIELAMGIVRKEQPSKRVMDGWKKWFGFKDNINQIIKEGRNLLIMEDDVIVKVDYPKLMSEVKMDKINFVFYQKTFKEKGKTIAVGTQGVFIPNGLIKFYQRELLDAKSIHFDRWNSRLPNIYYACLPKECGEEITRVSATTGKVRKGKDFKEEFKKSKVTGEEAPVPVGKVRQFTKEEKDFTARFRALSDGFFAKERKNAPTFKNPVFYLSYVDEKITEEGQIKLPPFFYRSVERTMRSGYFVAEIPLSRDHVVIANKNNYKEKIKEYIERVKPKLARGAKVVWAKHAPYRHFRDFVFPEMKRALETNKELQGVFIAEADLFIYEGYGFSWFDATYDLDGKNDNVWLAWKKILSNYIVGNFFLYFSREGFKKLEQFIESKGQKDMLSDRFFYQLHKLGDLELNKFDKDSQEQKKPVSIGDEIEHFSKVAGGVRKSGVK